MWNQKVWSLSKFERLHIGGWGMKYKQQCYMFKVTYPVMTHHLNYHVSVITGAETRVESLAIAR